MSAFPTKPIREGGGGRGKRRSSRRRRRRVVEICLRIEVSETMKIVIKKTKKKTLYKEETRCEDVGERRAEVRWGEEGGVGRRWR